MKFETYSKITLINGVTGSRF